MAAFDAAVALGYSYVETDVHATRDGRLVAFHDDALDDLTDKSGQINDLDWNDVRQARVDGREPVPLFDDLLLNWPDLRINIEPKDDASVAPLLALLAREAAWDRVNIGSFSGARLARIRAEVGDKLCTSMGPWDVVRLRLASYRLPVGRFAARCVQVPPRQYGLPVVDRAFLAEAHRRGLPVHVWTLNEAAEIERFLDLGVDAVMSDRALLLKQIFQRRGLWPD